MISNQKILSEWALEQNPDATHAEVIPIRAGVWYVEVYDGETLVEAYPSGFGPYKLPLPGSGSAGQRSVADSGR